MDYDFFKCYLLALVLNHSFYTSTKINGFLIYFVHIFSKMRLL